MTRNAPPLCCAVLLHRWTGHGVNAVAFAAVRLTVVNANLLDARPDRRHRLPVERFLSALHPVELKSRHAPGTFRKGTQGVE